MLEKHGHSQNLFMYALAQMKRRRYATAQAFWVFAYDNLIKEQHDRTGKTRENKTLGTLITEIEEYYQQQKLLLKYKEDIRNLRKLNSSRIKIVHGSFINEHKEEGRLQKIMEALMYLIFDKNEKLENVKRQITPELLTDLELKFGDRIAYKREELKEYYSIKQRDFNNDFLFEEKIWKLKYTIEDYLKLPEYKELSELRTGLVSEFSVDSEWIWLPIGFSIDNENERVRKTIVSVLIMRNTRVRIYLDFGTMAIESREKYYTLLNKEDFRKLLKELCEQEPKIEFWQVIHYSSIIDRISIKQWLEGNQECCCKVNNLINEEKQSLKGTKSRRSNILLFGKEFPEDYFSQEKKIEDFAEDILEVVKILKPFLDIIEQEVKVG